VGGVILVARSLGRLWTVGAVLVGLLLMHGVGAAAATGCAGGVTAAASVASPGMAAGHDTTMVAVPSNTPTLAVLGMSPHPGGHGAMCVSTPPRTELGLVSPATLAATPPAAPVPGVGQVRGSMPRAGPELLISLCISRT
jgi:hypothetical protein